MGKSNDRDDPAAADDGGPDRGGVPPEAECGYIWGPEDDGATTMLALKGVEPAVAGALERGVGTNTTLAMERPWPGFAAPQWY
jgi:hypothetical protein